MGVQKKPFGSKYAGVSYHQNKWYAIRHSKNGNKVIYNGSYDNEETAVHASDTLARKLMENGEHGHKINFPDDHTEVYPEKTINASKYFGVCYHKHDSKWSARRWSKNENKMINNGCYRIEKTAAHASDTLARKLMENSERDHKLNFPDDRTEVHSEKKQITSKYIGVSYMKRDRKKNRVSRMIPRKIVRKCWFVQRRSKRESKMVRNGCYDNEEAAAHASDALARKLIDNGEQGHKLNFPEMQQKVFYNKKKRKREEDSDDEYVQ